MFLEHLNKSVLSYLLSFLIVQFHNIWSFEKKSDQNKHKKLFFYFICDQFSMIIWIASSSHRMNDCRKSWYFDLFTRSLIVLVTIVRVVKWIIKIRRQWSTLTLTYVVGLICELTKSSLRIGFPSWLYNYCFLRLLSRVARWLSNRNLPQALLT